MGGEDPKVRSTVRPKVEKIRRLEIRPTSGVAAVEIRPTLTLSGDPTEG